jgi:hypothetical protein
MAGRNRLVAAELDSRTRLARPIDRRRGKPSGSSPNSCAHTPPAVSKHATPRSEATLHEAAGLLRLGPCCAHRILGRRPRPAGRGGKSGGGDLFLSRQDRLVLVISRMNPVRGINGTWQPPRKSPRRGGGAGRVLSQGGAIVRESADTVNRASGPVTGLWTAQCQAKRKARAVAWERWIGAGQCCNVLCLCRPHLCWNDCPSAERVFRLMSTGRGGACADAAAVAHPPAGHLAVHWNAGA